MRPRRNGLDVLQNRVRLWPEGDRACSAGEPGRWDNDSVDAREEIRRGIPAADGLLGLTGLVGRLAEAQDRTDEQLRLTAEQLRAADARLRQADTELGEYIRTVESHLNILIQMFERHVRDPHGEQPS